MPDSLPQTWGAGADHWQYLALLGACVAITLPLEFVLGARVWRRPRLLLLSLLPMLVIFLAWDVVGIVRGHWVYNARFITGVHLGLVPLEEALFFVVVPICGLLTYGAVGRLWPGGSRARAEGRTDG